MGGAIQRAVKRPGDLAVRYGGEEFTVLLPNTDTAGAKQVVEDILDAIRALNIEHTESALGKVTASAGIAVSRPSIEDVTPAALLKLADAQLYLAKQQGRNRWCCAAGPTQQAIIPPL